METATLRRRPWALDAVARLGPTLCVWAHPDDESYLAGGLMAALRDAGQRVVCLTATRGESGEDSASGAGDGADPLGHRREQELTAALAALGVHEHGWLGHADGRCAAADVGAAAAQIGEVIDRVRPRTVVSFGPDGFTGHPDHRAVARWTAAAVSGVVAGRRPRLLQAALTPADRDAGRDVDDRFQVFALGEPRICPEDELAVRLVIGDDLLARKVEALRAHHSQTAALIDAVGVPRYAEWVRVESFVEAPSPRGLATGR